MEDRLPQVWKRHDAVQRGGSGADAL
jgi:hypothetical protein